MTAIDELSSNAQDPSPDGQVAKQIVEQLLAGGWIAASQVDQVRRGLAEGGLRSADWRLIAEKALEMEARHGQAR